MVQLYPKPPKGRKQGYYKRRWRVEYSLVYDGGGGTWNGYYRTLFGARIAAWWNEKIASWGGTVTLHNNRQDISHD